MIRRILLGTVLGMAAGCSGGAGTGAGAAPGVSGDTISIGMLTPLSDAVAVIGAPLAAGLTTYFDQLNAGGGVAGKYQVRVISEDITYANPSTGVQKYQKIKDQVAVFGMAVGTDLVHSLLPLLEDDSLVLLPTSFDGEWVRAHRLLPVGSPYQIQAINGLAYYLGEGGGAGTRICSLTLSTGYGEAGEQGLDFAARELGFDIAARARFRQDDQDFVAPITQLRNARCDAVFLVSLPGVTGRVLGAATQLGFAPRWIALAPSWHGTLAASALKDYFVEHLWISWEGVEWGDTTSVGMRGMLQAIAAHRPDQKPDVYFVVGYYSGRAVHALLEKAVALGDLSRGGLLRALEQMGRVSFDGLSGDYDYGPAASRSPPRVNTIFRINPDKPFGWEVLKAGVTSPAAQAYSFAPAP
jgi:ABC-type branched-subunit amino acid transport system substrate-binding protein